jgi:drug/metabolite transporter (DMT)-like permease
MRLILFIAIVILTGTAGDLAVSHAMKQIGHVSPITPSGIFRFLALAFQMVWLWIGIALMATGFFSLLALLSWADVSLVVPATALSYVAGAFGAKFLLKEHVAPVRWAGVLLVCLGVALISLS